MPDCTCEKCIQACREHPGWMTPDEARRAIAMGFGPWLMRERFDQKHFVLLPAIKGGGRESSYSFWRHAECTFLYNGRCSIHASGFKPVQCRESLPCKGTGPVNSAVADLWLNPEAQHLVQSWWNNGSE